jgi:hypothetical protein
MDKENVSADEERIRVIINEERDRANTDYMIPIPLLDPQAKVGNKPLPPARAVYPAFGEEGVDETAFNISGWETFKIRSFYALHANLPEKALVTRRVPPSDHHITAILKLPNLDKEWHLQKNSENEIIQLMNAFGFHWIRS